MKIEWNDIRAFLSILNLGAFLYLGRSFAIFGVCVAILGLMKDYFVDKKISGAILHSVALIMSLMVFFS
jgi:proteasome assembly chaperone (PAC2) family protein